MASYRSLHRWRFVFALLLTLAGVFTLPLNSSAWPGAHKTLQCTDCHLVMPDPQVDTIDTVTFVNSDPEELCLGCHEGMRNTAGQNPTTMMFAAAAVTATPFKHNSAAIVTQSMYSHYLQWINEHGGEYSPPLTENALPMYANGSDHQLICGTCHPGLGGGYPRIPMTNMELCIVCHGGEGNADFAGADPRFSSSPRVLYNATHLGVTEGSAEYPPPGGAPTSGAHVGGAIPLPLTVVKNFHKSYQENLAYRIEIDFFSDGSIDQTVTDFPERTSLFTPMRWYTGEPPRWVRELELHRQDTSSWPAGTHVLRIVPSDPLNLIDGNAYALSLVTTGASCDVAIANFQASSGTLNTSAGESVTFSGDISSSQAVDWRIDIVSPYPPEGGSGEIIVDSFAGTGETVSAIWDGRDPFLNIVPPGDYLARLTATSGPTCSGQALAVVSVDPFAGCSLNAAVGSSVNLASGTLAFSQELFSARGGRFRPV